MLELKKIKHFDKLRQIPPETGRFLSLLAANSADGQWAPALVIQPYG